MKNLNSLQLRALACKLDQHGYYATAEERALWCETLRANGLGEAAEYLANGYHMSAAQCVYESIGAL